MRLKKSLGQNFLTSKKALADIVRAADIMAGETVLEAGPGMGVLTEALLKAGAKVIAVEKDRRLIPVLKEKFATDITYGGLILIEADVLDFDFQIPTLRSGSRPPPRGVGTYKLIANIPYYITGAFIRKFLEAEKQPSRMVLLIQKEVAERIVTKDKKESLLSLSVKAYGTPRYVETVKAGSFSPPPKVDSAIIAIENISRELFRNIPEKEYFGFLHAAFKQRRKKLAPQLGAYGDRAKIEKALSDIGSRTDTRAEDVAAENWPKLFRNLNSHDSKTRHSLLERGSGN